ncbi:MAG: PD-(D/E)XK nuclease family protein, partial [Acidobacteria bacterium]|nr:PD-(D/E)XK nuclease family protein [Acidobacteriota bacterium]
LYSAGLHDLSPIQSDLLEALTPDHVPLQESSESLIVCSRTQRFVAARGIENEIRGVFRRAIAERIPLDSVEIVHTQRDTYVPAVLELLSEQDLPVTFEEGIPVPYTRPGRAIMGFFEWLRLGWDATVLRKLISSGVIDTGEVGPVLAARIFRKGSIGWGRARHLERMNGLVREYERKARRFPDNERDEKRVSQARMVRDLVRQLIDGTPKSAASVSVSELAGQASRFLSSFARVASQADGAAKDALLRVLEEVQSLPDRREPLAAAAVRLDELVRDISVLSEAPRPGAIHLSPVETAGWGGRSHLFVLGLDERFPGGELQDPVMLDEERAAVNRRRASADLPLSASRVERALRAMYAMLQRSEVDSITFSFSYEEVLEDREALPSPFLLDLWRTIEQLPDASYDDMIRNLSPSRETFVAAQPVSGSEAWIRRIQSIMSTRGLSGMERESIIQAMASSWPWLSRGLQATLARQGREISPWSGKIAVAPDELDPRLTGKPISASRLEQLAQSPFRYFLQNVLFVEPLEELERRPEEWLEAREFGGLFHDVLYEFMSRIVDRGEQPHHDRHIEEFRSIALDQLDKLSSDIPAPSAAAFDLRKRELLEAGELFLAEETRWCETNTPRWFEVPFGLPGSGDSFGSDEPVPVDLGEFGTLPIRGRIDRIDQCGPNRFMVWDYKSGSSFKYADHEYLSRGTQVQHALYAIATRELLRRSGIEGEVVGSGYYFPTRKGRARRVSRTPPFIGEQQERLATVLGGLLDAVRHGSFIHAIDENDCTFCDFISICGGDAEAVARETKRMSRSSGDQGVAAFMRAKEVG